MFKLLGPILHVHALLELSGIQKQGNARFSCNSKWSVQLDIQLKTLGLHAMVFSLSPFFPFSSQISIIEEALWIIL